jgi:uncharacterized protein YgiM (DUF1202 family)
MFGKIVVGTLVLAGVVGVAWVAMQLMAMRATPQFQKAERGHETLFFDYTVSAEAGHIRVSGIANFPNGVILVGTLERVGHGPLEVKEALVMNRLFAMEFGPALYVQYYLHNPQDALAAGWYRLSIEFDPAHQSPFAKESLQRSPLAKASPTPENGGREIDPAIIRVSRTFAIGSAEEQQEVQAREHQYRQTIRQHLRDTLGTLTGLWHGLRSQYQQERLKGGFSRTDPRANAWEMWADQWLHDLKDAAAKAQLHEAISQVSPYYSAWEALRTSHKQLSVLRDRYFEVLVNERSSTDRELQWAEQVLQYALGDAIAEFGQAETALTPLKAESARPSVIITSPLVNVRSGPGMTYEAISQWKKDAVLTLLSEQGEWFQVQLSGGRTGWVHQNVVRKHPQGDGTSADVKPGEGRPWPAEKRARLQLEPLRVLSTPIDHIPRPTSDEVKIYAEIELQLRDLQTRQPEERKVIEHGVLQRMSDKYGISPGQVWNTYLKVQGWEIKQ